MSAPVPQDPRGPRSRTKEVGLICVTVIFVAMLIYAPNLVWWVLVAFVLLVVT